MSIPQITGINPTIGAVQGGQTITLYGSHFTGVTEVSFGLQLSSFTIISDHEIKATSPAGMNNVYITATNDEGTSTPTSSSQFSYIDQPIITSINPPNGSISGGTLIDIVGSNFTGTSSVTINGNQVLNLIVESDVLIKATTPVGSGPAIITVTNVAGSTSVSGFDYISPPLITSITPSQGPDSGGNMVIVAGTSLFTTSSVYCGSNLASFIIDSDLQLTITIPPGTGTVPITVINSVGTSNGLSYGYVGTPTLTSLSIQSGSTNGNDNLLITGNNLSQTTSVEFDSQSVNPLYIISNTQLVVTTPSHSAGTIDVSVTTPGGQSNSLPYTYVNPPNI